MKGWRKNKKMPFQAIRIENTETAQNAPTPTKIYALFYDGEYLTKVILRAENEERRVWSTEISSIFAAEIYEEAENENGNETSFLAGNDDRRL